MQKTKAGHSGYWFVKTAKIELMNAGNYEIVSGITFLALTERGHLYLNGVWTGVLELGKYGRQKMEKLLLERDKLQVQLNKTI